MIKLKLTISLITLLTSISFAQQADIIIGKYRLPNKLDIEIFKTNNTYFGKIIALNGFENGQLKDINNPDRSKRKDSLLGKLIIKGLEYDKEEKRWIKGSMYGAEKGLFFNLKITEVRQNEIVVVGSKFVMRKTIKWEKL